ncbi:MAG: septal ring lytic transglycosylase RlpA family protein [Acidobacteriota bacterium]|nr:septal ring lytic transglycosylase RlpA family protein [Acidobacteriota bacterium]
MHKVASLSFAGFLFAATFAQAEGIVRDSDLTPSGALPNCYERNVPLALAPAVDQGILRRIITYTQLAVKHRVNGLASYYSSFFDGRKTANGEIFRNGKYSAAHLTLPLGTWVEVTSRATGRKLRLRVNDRGPYAKKFCLDLSQAAAKYLGVDVARDRHVNVRIIALPGEEPIPAEIDLAALRLPAIDSEGGSRTAGRSQ